MCEFATRGPLLPTLRFASPRAFSPAFINFFEECRLVLTLQVATLIYFSIGPQAFPSSILALLFGPNCSQKGEKLKISAPGLQPLLFLIVEEQYLFCSKLSLGLLLDGEKNWKCDRKTSRPRNCFYQKRNGFNKLKLQHIVTIGRHLTKKL